MTANRPRNVTVRVLSPGATAINHGLRTYRLVMIANEREVLVGLREQIDALLGELDKMGPRSGSLTPGRTNPAIDRG